jgi:hypothetical protein
VRSRGLAGCEREVSEHDLAWATRARSHWARLGLDSRSEKSGGLQSVPARSQRARLGLGDTSEKSVSATWFGQKQREVGGRDLAWMT